MAVGVIAAGLFLFFAVVAPASPPGFSVVAGNATIGQAIDATAQLSESPGAGGEISFEVFGPDDPSCVGTGLTVDPAPVAGEGEYVSGSYFPPTAGEYHWSAHYSGDGVNPPADSSCLTISTVAKAGPAITGAASAGVVGAAIHDEATLTGGFAPSGEVTFTVYAPGDTGCSTPLNSASAPIQSAHATSADFLPQQAGEFLWTASYPGDANNEPFSLGCGAANQGSVVSKAAPTISGVASSVVIVGTPITDSVTLAGGFGAGGELLFRAYGPGDETCGTTPKYEEAVPVIGNGPYSPAGFSPPPGVYRWTVDYSGDANNATANSPCGAAGQASAVGRVAVTVTASASGGIVGNPLSATATIAHGAIPAGQITFRAFPPADANCSGAAVFSSVVGVAGNGSYRSANFIPSRVGTFRWTVVYSGDGNHEPAATGCGEPTAVVSRAAPTITGAVAPRLTVGTPIRDRAMLLGGYAPTGKITFQIYTSAGTGCARPAFVDTVAISGNGAFESDPFVALRPGRYSFVASYSGDAANQAVSEPCDAPGQVVVVVKRKPTVRPRAVLLERRRISIRARLSGATNPSGVINFYLYGPGSPRCEGAPAFSGSRAIKSNGTFALAEYLATKRGIYHLGVGYSGDARNQRYRGSCKGAQPIRIS